MNGAESLIKTLKNCDVDVCFINPGTSEMHFVAALDEVDGFRCVLGLFEGVVSGAADGYARMAGKPAVTLTHLGVGLANALANIHNARRGKTPMVNIVGDHATYHLQYDAPLTSDIEGIAGPMSDWVYTSKNSKDIARDTARAVQAAGHNKVATLMLPTDVSWSDNPNGPAEPLAIAPREKVSAEDVAKAAEMLADGDSTMVFIGGAHIDVDMGIMMSKISKATGARVGTECLLQRVTRGEGSVALPRLPYRPELAMNFLQGVKKLVLVGAEAPVAFFAYPNQPSVLTEEGCEILQLATADHDLGACLNDLATAVNAQQAEADTCARVLPPMPSGPLTISSFAEVLANGLPDNAVVVDEGSSAGVFCYGATTAAAPHDWMMLTGGSIGWGIPSSIGAAVASPDRKVVCLAADGGAMYTVQGLWSLARENLDVTVIILNNKKYNILEAEFAMTGAKGGKPRPKAASVMDIGNPDIDFLGLARGMGITATRATTAEELREQMEAALSAKGPRVIDAIIPPVEF